MANTHKHNPPSNQDICKNSFKHIPHMFFSSLNRMDSFSSPLKRKIEPHRTRLRKRTAAIRWTNPRKRPEKCCREVRNASKLTVKCAFWKAYIDFYFIFYFVNEPFAWISSPSLIRMYLNIFMSLHQQRAPVLNILLSIYDEVWFDFKVRNLHETDVSETDVPSQSLELKYFH